MLAPEAAEGDSTMRARVLLLAAVALTPGCGSKYVPVSGKVTLNGKPLANALVAFNRIPDEGSIEAGPSALGQTNENGEFTLRVSPQQAGALVGTHRVAITLMSSRDGESDAPMPPAVGMRNIIPARYNAKTELTCVVPRGGTDQANFELTSP
jgi:hypothetical protein